MTVDAALSSVASADATCGPKCVVASGAILNAKQVPPLRHGLSAQPAFICSADTELLGCVECASNVAAAAVLALLAASERSQFWPVRPAGQWHL